MITFLTAETPQKKIHVLMDTVISLFQQGKRMTILAPNAESLTYLDSLLWSYKPELFLPHAIASSPVNEIIVLTQAESNLNRSDALINITLAKPISASLYPEIYELLDETTPERAEASRKKRESY